MHFLVWFEYSSFGAVCGSAESGVYYGDVSMLATLNSLPIPPHATSSAAFSVSWRAAKSDPQLAARRFGCSGVSSHKQRGVIQLRRPHSYSWAFWRAGLYAHQARHLPGAWQRHAHMNEQHTHLDPLNGINLPHHPSCGAFGSWYVPLYTKLFFAGILRRA